MKKILVTTDFSKSAENAVTVAAHIANQMGCQLHLLHVYHIPVPVGDMPFPFVSIKELEADVLSAMVKNVNKINIQFPALQVETQTQAGLASEDIASHADADPDIVMVVMGLTGAGAAAQWLFGSTSVSVAKSCKKPVLLVPEDASWMPLKDVVFASDFGNIDNVTGMDLFFTMCKKDGASVHILNVAQPGEIPSSEEAVNGIKLDHVFSGINHTYDVMENKDVEKGMDEFLAGKKIQMITMVRRKHNWLERLISGGHTRKMPYHSHVPVLILHEC